MRNWIRYFKDEKANAIVENVIVLPMIFVVIISILITAFVVYDRATMESAAKRGAIYAAHCISDPNYASVVASSGSESGALDISGKADDISFAGIGKNIKAYRYITGSGNVDDRVVTEVKNIISKTRLNLIPLGDVTVTCDSKNMFIYQDVVVSVTAKYTIPEIYGLFGLETEYTYTATGKITANDPDEFIRNADLVVDLIASAINSSDGGFATGVKKTVSTISDLADKLLDWLSVGK